MEKYIYKKRKKAKNEESQKNIEMKEGKTEKEKWGKYQEKNIYKKQNKHKTRQ